MERGDMRSAIVACMIANTNRGKGKKPFKPEDFMPKFDDGKPKWNETDDPGTYVGWADRAEETG